MRRVLCVSVFSMLLISGGGALSILLCCVCTYVCTMCVYGFLVLFYCVFVGVLWDCVQVVRVVVVVVKYCLFLVSWVGV